MISYSWTCSSPQQQAASEAIKQDLLSRGNTINCWYKTTAEISVMQQHLLVQLVCLSLVNLRWSVFFYMLLSLQVCVGQILVALDLALETWWSIPSLFQVLVGRSLRMSPAEVRRGFLRCLSSCDHVDNFNWVIRCLTIKSINCWVNRTQITISSSLQLIVCILYVSENWTSAEAVNFQLVTPESCQWEFSQAADGEKNETSLKYYTFITFL